MHLTIAWLFKLYKIEEKALIVYCTLMVEGIVKVVREGPRGNAGSEGVMRCCRSFHTISAACILLNGIKYISLSVFS